MTENSGEASSSNMVHEEESEIEVNIKTLDSQIYKFRVDKNIQVSLFKKIVEDKTGVPVVQQRLIFRGKVLKDDHLLSHYHIEDGHTLHLVVRQPVQSQDTLETSFSENNRNSEINRNNVSQANDSAIGGPQGRVGQVSHSILLGTFNVGSEQGEGIVPDLNRIVGAVLNSVGIGNVTTHGGTNNMSAASANSGAAADGGQGSAASHIAVGNQGQSAQGFAVNHPVHFMFQPHPLPLPGMVTLSPQAMVIPDSLVTLTEYISQMELGFSVGGSQSYQPGVRPRRDTVPSGTRGLPTTDDLTNVMRRVHQLLIGHVGAALSTMMGRLEREGANTDPAVRAQIQAEAMQVGVAMQHLGSLFLELGRTIMTLRLGQSPAEAFVNAGPAVYISHTGPNPLMVQPPMPLNANAFGIPAAVAQVGNGNFGPGGAGDVTRNINIHIHAGSSMASALSSVGTRANHGEAPQNQTQASGDGAVSTRPGPVRNIVAAVPDGAVSTRPGPVRNIVAAVPARSSAEAASRVLSVFYPIQARSQPANIGGNSGHESQSAAPSNSSSGFSHSLPQPCPLLEGASRTQVEASICDGILQDSTESTVEPSASQPEGNYDYGYSTVDSEPLSTTSQSAEHCSSDHHADEEGVRARIDTAESSLTSSVINSASVSTTESFHCKEKVTQLERHTCGPDSPSDPGSSKIQEAVDCSNIVPLGLGSGGLQLKRKANVKKPQENGGSGSAMPSRIQQSTIAKGQRFLQTLLLGRSPNKEQLDADQPSVTLGQDTEPSSVEEHEDMGGGFDAASAVSQIINSQAVDNVLAAVSEQTGLVSPNDMRGMLQQFTQSPQMRSMLNQISQQMEGNVLSQMAGGMDGTLDLSRMFQQVMPSIFQVLGSATVGDPALQNGPSHKENESNRYENVTSHKENESNRYENALGTDLQHIAACFESEDHPHDIFRRVVESAGRLYSRGIVDEDHIEEICQDVGLAEEYTQMLRREIDSRKSFGENS